MSCISRSSVQSVSKESWAPYRRVPKENGKGARKGRADLKRARDRLEAERTRQAERILQEQEEQEHLAKKMRSHHQDVHEGASGQGGEAHSGNSSSGSSGLKRNAPEAAPSTPEDITQNLKVRIIEEERDEDEQMTEQMTEELNCVERMMREDFQWPTVDLVSVLCEPELKWNNQQKAAHEYWDEVTGLPLDPQLVASGENDELDRFRKMGVYSYVPREQAEQDMEGTFVRTKWVRIDKGTPASPTVRCRLVAH